MKPAAAASRSERRPHTIAVLALLVASLLVSFGLAETGLRLAGYRPWSYAEAGPDDPTLHEPDPLLGWRNKPGHTLVHAHLAGQAATERTILADGSRATGGAERPASERVDLVGCSVTVGYDLSDADTYAWKLQQLHPELQIVNFGTAAYGTYQSLLRMERIRDAARPSLVLYGFITQHEARNVATYDWLRGLALHSIRGHVAPPYVTLGADHELVRHPPESFAVWPLADRSVAVRMLGDAYMHLVTRARDAQAPEATKALLLEMSRVARRRSTPFAVLFLLAEDGKKDEYLAFFRENDVPFVDCVEPFTEENRIAGTGHPNAKLNSFWARCISENLPGLRKIGPRAS